MTTGTAHALVSLVPPAWVDWLKKPCYSTLISDQTIFYTTIVNVNTLLSSHMLSAACMFTFFVDVFVVDLSFKDICSHDDTGWVEQQIWKGWWQRQQSWYGAMVAAPVHEGLTSHCPHACIWLPIAPELQKYWGRYWSVMDAQQSFGAGEKQIENW